MKNIKYKILIFGSAATIFGLSCNKSFLDKQPLGSLSPTVLANRTGIDGLLIGAYHMVGGIGGAAGTSWGAAASNWAYANVSSDDAYKGSIITDQGNEGLRGLCTWNVETNNGYINSKWVAMYDGIQRANDVIRTIPQATDIGPDDAKRIIAEAKFLRAFFHFELKKIFNYVPYVDENVTLGNNNLNAPNVDESGTFIEIWPKIEADFQAAIADLPETQAQAGRANKWAATAFLAKAYMYQHKYDDAKPLLNQLITSGVTASGTPYALVNYQSNFNGAQDNGAESVFAYQASVNDGSGTNGNYGDNLVFPNGSGPGGCCGFGNPSISLANAYKTDAAGLPLLDTYNTGNNVGDPTTPYVGTIDPRIDIVMGRPGIPYYDWGIVPNGVWIRDPSSDGYFSPKKNVYAKSQVGGISSTETSFWGPTQMSAINVNLLRYADILLWAAECEILGSGGDPDKALDYVNQVRTRAAKPEGWVYKNSDYDATTGKYKNPTPANYADNYSIGLYPAGAFDDPVYALKAIQFERRLELALEGHRWFDLQRWDNGTGTMADILNDYVSKEMARPSFVAQVGLPVHFDKGKDEFRPIPQAQIDIENSAGPVLLKQNPAY